MEEKPNFRGENVNDLQTAEKSLVNRMFEKGIPISQLQVSGRVLLLGSGNEVLNKLIDLQSRDFYLEQEATLVDGIGRAVVMQPDCVVIDLGVLPNAISIIPRLRALPGLERVVIIGCFGEERSETKCDRNVVDEIFRGESQMRVLAERIVMLVERKRKLDAIEKRS